MPFAVGETINGATKWICSSALVNKIVSNSVFAALIITAIILVIVMGLYYRTSVQKGGWHRRARAMVYALIVVSAVVFVHHYALRRMLFEEASQKGVRNVFRSIHEEQAMGGDSYYSAVGSGYAEETSLYAPGSHAYAEAQKGVPIPLPHGVEGGTGAESASPGRGRADNISAVDGFSIDDVAVPAAVVPARK